MATFSGGVDPELIKVLNQLNTTLGRVDKSFDSTQKTFNDFNKSVNALGANLDKIADGLSSLASANQLAFQDLSKLLTSTQFFNTFVANLRLLETAGSTAFVNILKALTDLQAALAKPNRSRGSVIDVIVSDLTRLSTLSSLIRTIDVSETLMTFVEKLVQVGTELKRVTIPENFKLFFSSIASISRSIVSLSKVDVLSVHQILLVGDRSLVQTLSTLFKRLEEISKQTFVPQEITSSINALSDFISSVNSLSARLKDEGSIVAAFTQLDNLIERLAKLISRLAAVDNNAQISPQALRSNVESIQVITNFIEQYVRLVNKTNIVQQDSVETTFKTIDTLVNNLLRISRNITSAGSITTTQGQSENGTGLVTTVNTSIRQLINLATGIIKTIAATNLDPAKVELWLNQIELVVFKIVTIFNNISATLAKIEPQKIEANFFSLMKLFTNFLNTFRQLGISNLSDDSAKAFETAFTSSLNALMKFTNRLLEDPALKKIDAVLERANAMKVIVDVWLGVAKTLVTFKQLPDNAALQLSSSIDITFDVYRKLAKLLQNRSLRALADPKTTEIITNLGAFWRMYSGFVKQFGTQARENLKTIDQTQVSTMADFLTFFVRRIMTVTRSIKNVNADTMKSFRSFVSAVGSLFNTMPQLLKSLDAIEKSGSGFLRRLTRTSGIDEVLRTLAYVAERVKELAGKYKKRDESSFTAFIDLARAISRISQAAPLLMRATEYIPDSLFGRIAKFWKLRRFFATIVDIIKNMVKRLSGFNTKEIGQAVHELTNSLQTLVKMGATAEKDLSKLNQIVNVFNRLADNVKRVPSVSLKKDTRSRSQPLSEELTKELNTIKNAVQRIDPTNWPIVRNMPVAVKSVNFFKTALSGLINNVLPRLYPNYAKLREFGMVLSISVSQPLKTAGDSLSNFGRQLLNMTDPSKLISSTGAKLAAEYDDLLKQFTVFASNIPLERVEELTQRIGIDYPLSANQALAAALDLAKAGLNIEQIESVLPSAADLSALSDSKSIERSTQTLIAVARGLRLLRDDMTSSFAPDAMEYTTRAIFAVANATTATIDSIQEGLSEAVPAANNFGQSLEQVVSVIGIFNDAQIRGSEAGRLFASTMTGIFRLNSQKVFESLGVALTTEEGRIRNLNDIIKDLAAALKPLNDASRLAIIRQIGDVFAQRGLGILLAREGFDDMIEAINNSMPAAEGAARLMESFQGQVLQLKGSLDTLIISIFTPILNKFGLPLVRFFRDVVNYLIELPEAVRNTVSQLMIFTSVLGTLVAVGTIVAGTIFKIIGIVSGLTAAVLTLLFGIKTTIAGFIAYFKLLKENENSTGLENTVNTVERLKNAINGFTFETIEVFIETLRVQYRGLSEALGGLLELISGLTDVDMWLQGEISLARFKEAISRVFFEITAILHRMNPRFFTDALFAFDAEQIGEGLFLLLRDGILAALSFLNKNAFLTESVLRAFLTVFNPFNLPALLAKLFGLNEVAEALSQLKESYVRVITGLVAVIATAFGQLSFAPVVLRNLGQAGFDLITFFTGIINLLKGLVQSATLIVQAIFEPLREGLRSINSESTTRLSSVTEYLAKIGETLTEFSANTLPSITNSLVNFVRTSSQLLIRWGAAIGRVVLPVLGSFARLIGQVIRAIGGIIAVLTGNMRLDQFRQEIGEDLIESFKDFGTSLRQAVEIFFNKLQIQNWVNPRWLGEKLQAVVQFLIQGLRIFVTSFGAIVASIVAGAAETFGSDALRSLADGIMNADVGLIATSLLQFIGEIFNSVVNGLFTLIFQTIPAQISSLGGILTGIGIEIGSNLLVQIGNDLTAGNLGAVMERIVRGIVETLAKGIVLVTVAMALPTILSSVTSTIQPKILLVMQQLAMLSVQFIMPMLLKVKTIAIGVFAVIKGAALGLIKIIAGAIAGITTAFGGFLVIVVFLAIFGKQIQDLGLLILNFTQSIEKAIDQLLRNLLGDLIGGALARVINLFVGGLGTLLGASIKILGDIGVFLRGTFDFIMNAFIIPIVEGTVRIIGGFITWLVDSIESVFTFFGDMIGAIPGLLDQFSFSQFVDDSEDAFRKIIQATVYFVSAMTALLGLLRTRFAATTRLFLKLALMFNILESGIKGLQTAAADNVLSGIVEFFERIVTNILRFFGLEDLARYIEEQISVWKAFFSFLTRQFERTVNQMVNSISASIGVFFAQLEQFLASTFNIGDLERSTAVIQLNEVVLQQSKYGRGGSAEEIAESLLNLSEVSRAFETAARLDGATTARIINANRDSIATGLINYYAALQDNPALIDSIRASTGVDIGSIAPQLLEDIGALNDVLRATELTMRSRVNIINTVLTEAQRANRTLTESSQDSILRFLQNLSNDDIQKIKLSFTDTNVVLNAFNHLLRAGKVDLNELARQAERFNFTLQGSQYISLRAASSVDTLTQSITDLNQQASSDALSRLNESLKSVAANSDEAYDAVRTFLGEVQTSAVPQIRVTFANLNRGLEVGDLSESQYRSAVRNYRRTSLRGAREQRSIAQQELLRLLQTNKITVEQYERGIKESDELYEDTVEEVKALSDISLQVQTRLARGEISREQAALEVQKLLEERRKQRENDQAKGDYTTMPPPVFGTEDFDPDPANRTEEIRREIESTEKEIKALEKSRSNIYDRMIKDQEKFELDQLRAQEDFHRDLERQREDHHKRLFEIEEKGSEDLIEAVAQRDSAAAQAAIRNREKELKKQRESYEIEQKRREEDYQLQRQRAAEDHRRRQAEYQLEIQEKNQEIQEKRQIVQNYLNELKEIERRAQEARLAAVRRGLDALTNMAKDIGQIFGDTARGAVAVLAERMPEVDEQVWNASLKIIGALQYLASNASNISAAIQNARTPTPTTVVTRSITPIFRNESQMLPQSSRITIGRAITRASGGNVNENNLYRVGELAPELFRQGNKLYMIPRQNGVVTPLRPIGSRNRQDVYNNTQHVSIDLGGIVINAPQNVNPQQIAAEVERQVIPRITQAIRRA